MADSAPVREFYGSVLGWRFAAGHANDGWQIEDVAPMGGIGGGADQPRTKPMWRVDDIAFSGRAGSRRRRHGDRGRAAQPYGTQSECVDDQGSHFYLGQL